MRKIGLLILLTILTNNVYASSKGNTWSISEVENNLLKFKAENDINFNIEKDEQLSSDGGAIIVKTNDGGTIHIQLSGKNPNDSWYQGIYILKPSLDAKKIVLFLIQS